MNTPCANPSEGSFIDLLECLWDKSPLASHNATYLSAVLRQRQRQQSGQKTSWVVHSQGAIIFCAAVAHHNLRFGHMPLNHHTVAIHAPGAHINKMKKVLDKAGITVTRVRQNPFDAVPNVAGTNDLRASSLWRSLRFLGLVCSSNRGHSGISPHTLPYLGLRTYKVQLELAGFSREAERVQNYIRQRDMARQKRRGR